MERLQPRAVIFDLGSTLIEYEQVPWDELGNLCIEAARQKLLSEGIDVPESEDFYAEYDAIREKYREIAKSDHIEWDVPTVARKMLLKLGVRTDDALVDLFFDAYYAEVDKQLYVYDDSAETLRLIKKKISIMGLISNTIFPEEVHLGELKKFGLKEYFDFTVFSSTFRLRKPHPDIFTHAANLAGVAPSECVYIGDRYLEDITGPNSVGMPAILKVKSGREYPPDMPDDVRRISTLSELSEHIEF